MMSRSAPSSASAVVGSHGKPGWWFATVRRLRGRRVRPRRPRRDVRRRRRHRHPRHGARRPRHHHRRRGAPPRRLRGFLLRDHQGHPPLPVRRKAGPWGYDQQTRYEAVGRIETPDGGLGIVKEFEYLKAHTTKAHQGDLRGAADLRLAHPSRQAVQGRGRRGRALRRGDQRGAEGAGRGRRGLHPARRARARQRLGRGDGAALQPGHRRREGQARLPHLLRQPLRPLALRPRRTGPTSPASSRRAPTSSSSSSPAASCPSSTSGRSTAQDRELGAGVIDVKGFYPETPEDVARRIQPRARRLPAEKLYVNPDCGFGWSPRYMCNQKVRALAAGAVLARQELTGKK